MQIQINKIKIGNNRRALDEETIIELADSMSKIGLINPVTVNEDFTLIAGAHRIEAAKRLGWTEIACSVVSLSGLVAKLAELDENLIRNEGSYIERGNWLKEKKEIYEVLHPGAKHGGDRKSGSFKNQNEIISFCSDTAKKTGLSPRTIAHEIQIAEKVIPEAKEFIRQEGIPKSTALNMARLPVENQAQIVQDAIEIKQQNPEQDVKKFVADTSHQINEDIKARLMSEDARLLKLDKAGHSIFNGICTVANFSVYDNLDEIIARMVSQFRSMKQPSEICRDIDKAIEQFYKIRNLVLNVDLISQSGGEHYEN